MEKQTEKKLKTEIEKQGGLCLKFPSLFYKGFPDRIILLPHGRLAFVELKTKNKKPSLVQQRVHNELRSLGFRVAVIDNTDDIKDLDL